MTTTIEPDTKTCGMRNCDDQAVGWVRFQGIDIQRETGGCIAVPYTADADLCAEHMESLEADVEAGEVYILEQIDHRHGTSWHEHKEAVA